MLGDMLKELDPDLWVVLRSTLMRVFVQRLVAGQSLALVAFEGVGHWIMREAERVRQGTCCAGSGAELPRNRSLDQSPFKLFLLPTYSPLVSFCFFCMD